MRISAIAAIGEQRELGAKNTLLWHIPGELPRFKRITTGHPIIMGRKTFESIGKVLPQRTNIIITRDPGYSVEGGKIVSTLNDALNIAKEIDSEEIFIIGGGQVFANALSIVTRLYLTIVHATFSQADVFFPDYPLFTKIIEKEEGNAGEYTYTFLTLEKE